MLIPTESTPVVLERPLLTPRVAGLIRAAIVNGEYKLGQKLRESEISEKFGVSNSVVREAFHILQGEGLVVTDPHRGRSVFNITESTARNMVLLRASLESLAAYLAAGHITEAYKRKLTSVAATMRSVEPASYGEWVNLELEFHSTIWKAAKDELLERQLNQMVAMALSLSTVHFFKPNYGLDEVLNSLRLRENGNVEGHQLLCQFIVNGDPQEARKNMILHIMGETHKEMCESFFQIRS
jgi:DNA-binding GntR family transcriptional regulator